MTELPPLPAQDIIFALSSAGILLWALLYMARSGVLDGAQRRTARNKEPELFSTLEPSPGGGHLSFLGSLFVHLFLVALIPTLGLLFPDQLDFNIDQYDLVIVQFRTKEAPFRLPADLAARRRKDPVPAPIPDDALPGDQDDPGRGNRIDAPKLEKKPGGEPAPKPERAVLEIMLPERPAPAREALTPLDQPELVVELAKIDAANTAMEFTTPDLSTIRNPGLPALAELDLVQAPQLAVHAGQVGMLPPGLVPIRGMTPALGDFAGPADLGPDGYSSLLADGSGDEVGSLLGQAIFEGALGELFGGGSGEGGIGGGSGVGIGDGSAAGASGGGGDGFGLGWGGRSPVPRKLHGIIMISNEAASLPEAIGVLTGNPIYTVYVEVPESSRKWVFQVCIPAASGGSLDLSGDVVRVVSRKRVDPPYAFKKIPLGLRLTAERWRAMPERIVVYATVDEEGELANLRVVSGADPEVDGSVLAKLQEWDFAPAYRDGQPVAVEALFGIPLW